MISKIKEIARELPFFLVILETGSPEILSIKVFLTKMFTRQ